MNNADRPGQLSERQSQTPIETVEDAYPLSPMQQGMLFHSLYAPGSGVDIEQVVCTLREAIDAPLFEQAWQRAVARHSILRTSFRWEGLDRPIQEVHRQVRCPLEQRDWQGLSKREQERQLQTHVRADRQRGFNLAMAPLMRLALFQLAEADYRFIWTFHHALLDGRSFPLVLQEVFAFYEAFRQGQELDLELPRPYRDYIEWLDQQDLSKAKVFWQQTLEGFTTPTPLVPAKPMARSVGEEGNYSVQETQLPESLTSALQSLAQHHQLTLNTLVQGAWSILLSCYSGEKDVVFGATRACRQSALEGVGTASMVGLFINTLPVRAHAAPDKPVLTYLEELRAQSLAVREYEHTPLVKIQEWSDISASTPLFETLMVFQRRELNTALRAQGGDWENREFQILRKVNYPITLNGIEQPSLTLRIEYNQGRFEDGTITQMLGHLHTLLQGFVEDPEGRIADLPLLTEAERHQLLVEWNATQADYPQDQCIHQLFEAQAAHSPDNVAVVFEDRQLTYDELNRRANQLAHHLQAMDVGPEVLVGLCVERSLEMVVGLMGVLKAGGAYVPLDPAYPKERLAFMLADAQMSVLLTQERLVSGLPAHEAQIVLLDGDWETIAHNSDEDPITGAASNNLAYVIYTSGSTGQPKGVLLEHEGLCNLAAAQIQLFNPGPDSRVLQFASLSFDASIWETVMALCSGARLCLGLPDAMQPGEPLLQTLREQAITHVTLPPSTLVVLPSEGLPALRTVIAAGEACSAELVARWAPGRRFFNAYGPTETTVCATVAEWSDANRKPPIGRPIANTQVYILDHHLHPVPVGVPGELYVGGVGLARGYLNRPELGAQHFIPNLFSDEPGARLYKTGDRARYLRDGNIEFLGRTDYQVKIRGFRIELGEIETVLAGHPAVREATVLDWETPSGDKRLIAYFVAEHKPAPTLSELRRFLRAKLPDHMVPSTFVELEAMPLTPSGKVDRQALPAPDTSRPELAATYVAPRTPEEEMLTGLWAEVLGLDRIGVYDDFFDLGGHSLQAVQLISKISTALGRSLSVKLIFLHPTVAALTAALGSLPATDDESIPAESLEHDAATLPSPGLVLPPFPSLLKIEHRRLLPLFATGKIDPVDSATISYLMRTSFTSKDMGLRDWFDDLPVFTRVIETFLGRIALIHLPHLDTDLYADQEDLARTIIEGLEMAKFLGARTVSLAGLIPSATDYGWAVATAAARRQDLPPISTGHATTTATVILTLERTLRESGRDLAQEQVGILGLGSIGVASLRLMLRALPHPPEIILCDLYSKPDLLERIKREIVADLSFQGSVHITKSQDEAPPEFYEATLIIGATSVPYVLDAARLKPGTIVVDDSHPYCFNPEMATRRFLEQGDILFTEGGVAKSPRPISELRYVPRSAPGIDLSELGTALSRGFKHHPFNITGCVLSGLLSACFEHLKPTLGLVDVETCFEHYEMLGRLGFQGADLHLADYTLNERAIRDFRRRFGK